MRVDIYPHFNGLLRSKPGNSCHKGHLEWPFLLAPPLEVKTGKFRPPRTLGMAFPMGFPLALLFLHISMVSCGQDRHIHATKDICNGVPYGPMGSPLALLFINISMAYIVPGAGAPGVPDTAALLVPGFPELWLRPDVRRGPEVTRVTSSTIRAFI